MKRREILAGLSLAGGIALAAAAQAQSQSHDHHHAPAASRLAGLIATSADCIATGRACLDHCFAVIAAGDTSIVACARQVNELIAACQALHALALANSRHIVSLAKALRAVCASCEAECRKHAAQHAQCKACADSCTACLKAIDTLA